MLTLLTSCTDSNQQFWQTKTDTESSKVETTSFIAFEESSEDVFEKRILPLFQAKKPSSCTECHLSGVELKDYIRSTQKETFASLVADGMIDLKKPDESKILQFINRKPEKSNLVSKKVREQEYAAFRDWILTAVKDPELLAAKANGLPIGPQVPDEVIRHARKDRVLESFLENVWTEVGRCAACHSPDRNKRQVEKFGEQVSWIRLKSPKATLDYMIEADLIDAKNPENSSLLTKPTLQEEHAGGRKMVVGDRAYRQIRTFIDDYASIVNSKYKTAKDIPKRSDEVSVVTKIVLRITDVPIKYDKMLLQVDLHRMTDAGWSKSRIATSDNAVFGKKRLWQHSLSLIAKRESRWAKQIRNHKLPPGKYLAKIYIDQKGKMQKDYTKRLGKEEFIAEVEIKGQWRPGPKNATVIHFPKD